MGLRVRAASAFDMLHVQDLSGRALVRYRKTFGLLAMQVANSAAVAVVEVDGDGRERLACVAGLWWGDGKDAIELWFGTGPALKANLLRVLGELAIALEAVAREFPGLVVTAYVDPRSVAGDRLAALFGFEPAGVTDTEAGELKAWRRVL